MLHQKTQWKLKFLKFFNHFGQRVFLAFLQLFVLREVGKVFCKDSWNEKFFLLDFKSFVGFNNKSHDLFHDWSNLIYNKYVKHLQKEFGVNF